MLTGMWNRLDFGALRDIVYCFAAYGRPYLFRKIKGCENTWYAGDTMFCNALQKPAESGIQGKGHIFPQV